VRLIADGARNAAQLELLAGVDVCLIAPGPAATARIQPDISFRDRTGEDYRPVLAPHIDIAAIRPESLWEIPAELTVFARALEAEPPRTPAELEERGCAAGLGDLFPRLSFGDLEYIAREGRIARHARWADRIRDGRLAIDSLLNLAGLAARARVQARLDERIRTLL
jgi:transaldolase